MNTINNIFLVGGGVLLVVSFLTLIFNLGSGCEGFCPLALILSFGFFMGFYFICYGGFR